MEPSLSFHEGEPRFQTNPVFIRQSFFPDCRCLENFSIRNLVLVNRYRRLEDSSSVSRIFHRNIHSTPSLGKILENTVSGGFSGRRERERFVWKMENGAGNFDFRIGKTWLSFRAGRRRRFWKDFGFISGIISKLAVSNLIRILFTIVFVSVMNV